MNRVALGGEGKRVMDEIAGKVRDTFNRLHRRYEVVCG